jgi:hypothetical protein
METQVADIARLLLALRIRRGEAVTATTVKDDVASARFIAEEDIGDDGHERILRAVCAMHGV